MFKAAAEALCLIIMFTYFEEHDVIAMFNVVIVFRLAGLYTEPHPVGDFLQIVGPEHDLHRRAE